MKKGDKVRFLSEVGGGIVTGFKDKDTVLVQDADGFDIPMPIRECVVVDTDDYNIAKVNTGTRAKRNSPEARGNAPVRKEEAPAHTFVPKPVERKEAERLNLYLAFVPADNGQLTGTLFEAYLVNDSNYFIQFVYMCAEGAAWRVRYKGTVEPNTKLFMEEFDKAVLNDLERVCVQCMAYKQDKTFLMKPVAQVELRIDTVKFYKPHTFMPSDFFTENALIYEVIRDDKPVRSLFVDASQLQEALLGARKEDKVAHGRSVSKPAAKPGIVEVDLHIHELVDSTQGMDNKAMLQRQLAEFRDVMQQHLGHKGQKIVFIHGKGEGVLRNELIRELKHSYKQCTWQDASFREYGFGATMVTIH